MSGHPAASARPVTLRLSLGCELGEVRAAVQTMRGFLAEQGWSGSDLMSLELALVEACNNAVKYAGEAARQRPIELEALSEAARVELRVHDHTGGFNWPEKIGLPALESESGRGLFLIQSLMDQAGYLRGQDENVLFMRKRRPANPAAIRQESVESYARKLAESDQVIGDMVEELSSCYECLSAIFRYSTEQSKAGSLKEFAERLAGDLLQILSAEWFVLRLVSKDKLKLAVFAASEPALELEPLEFPGAGQAAQSAEMEAALTRQRVWFDMEDSRAAEVPLKRLKPDSAGLAHPILWNEQLIGTLTLGKPVARHLLRRQGDAIFTAARTNVVNTFVDFLAIQIANARFQEERVNQRLMTRELEIAKGIQRSLLLTALPQLPGFGLAAFCRSAHEVGGDFYDVLKINEESALLVIADVMGKGIPAAMFAAMLRTLLRAAPELTRQPAALLERVNRLLFPELSGVDMFITAQLMYVNARERKAVAASAGHCPLAVATGAGVKTFMPEGMPLGILPDSSFQEETVDLPEGCRALMYTDGLTEALNGKREYFGQQRLMDWLAGSALRSGLAEEFKLELANSLEQYQMNAPLNDDQTFLIMTG